MRLFFWYVVAVYLFGPLVVAPFSGGLSLFGYFMPFYVFSSDEFVTGLRSIGVFLGVAFLLWAIHIFTRYTIRHQVRRTRAMEMFRPKL